MAKILSVWAFLIWERIGIALDGARGAQAGTGVPDNNFVFTGSKAIGGVDMSAAALIGVCLSEHERRFSGYDARLLRPYMMPHLMRSVSRFAMARSDRGGTITPPTPEPSQSMSRRGRGGWVRDGRSGRARHAISSLICSDLFFGPDSLPEALPFAPIIIEARIARPAWANHSPHTHIRQGAAGPRGTCLAAMYDAPYPLRQTVASHHCL